MAHEELMRELPKGVRRVSEHGIFYVKDDHIVVVLTNELVTCGGEPEGIAHAEELARALNEAWNNFHRAHKT